MDFLYGISVFVNLVVGLVFGVTVSDASKKSTQEGPSTSRLILIYGIIGIGMGLLFGLITQDVFTSEHYNTISDILVGLFGFSGLIFTFLIGNILRNESDLMKNIGDYEIKQDEALLVHGSSVFNKYQKRIDEFDQSLSICKNNFQRSMGLGLLSIGLFFVSLLCVILEPYFAKIEVSGVYLNIWLFATLFLGFIYLFLSLAYVGSPSPDKT